MTHFHAEDLSEMTEPSPEFIGGEYVPVESLDWQLRPSDRTVRVEGGDG
jgi:hypothetical protein